MKARKTYRVWVTKSTYHYRDFQATSPHHAHNLMSKALGDEDDGLIEDDEECEIVEVEEWYDK